MLRIAGISVKPGEKTTINIPVAQLHTHTEMTMPVNVIRGKKPGPHLFVCAAVHGDEITGVEIIRRLLKRSILKRMRGTLLSIPVVNVYGFINNTRYLPDRRDLNRFFPGSEQGSLTSRLAKIFMQEIVANSTHGIDLHAGSNHRINLPQIRADMSMPATAEMAMAFGPPVILEKYAREGSLRHAVQEKGVPILLYEAGEALRLDEVSIRAGVKGILAVMQHLGMLTGRSIKRPKYTPLVAKSSVWVRATTSGMQQMKTPLGRQVCKGDKIGQIVNPFGESETDIISTASGIVIGSANLPLVHEGDALVHVAEMEERTTSVQSTIQKFQDEFGA